MPPDPVVTGMGVVTASGQGKQPFAKSLLDGRSAFGVMRRPGRQLDSAYIGAELEDIASTGSESDKRLRSASLTTRTALAVLREAWIEAELDSVDPRRIGIVVGGSNVQQRELAQLMDTHRDRPEFLRPTYGLLFMDSDVCGCCTSQSGIRGLAFSAGGASASGQLALILAAQAIGSGQVDICIGLGALMDLSHWEFRALRALGAMGSERYASEPGLACRPFDRNSDGFIFGEASAAVVLESQASSQGRGRKPYAALRGWSVVMDGNRNPNPSVEGESESIQEALRSAGWAAADVDYVNPHGTGSTIGDQTELDALATCGLTNAYLNTTKSLTGHGLTAAGAVEVVATMLQMREGFLHPSRNLDEPIQPNFRWVTGTAAEHQVEKALTLSMGFGGINTAMCWERIQPEIPIEGDPA